jgi:hypothetical protein
MFVLGLALTTGISSEDYFSRNSSAISSVFQHRIRFSLVVSNLSTVVDLSSQEPQQVLGAP